MRTDDEFRPVGEVVADERGRIAFGKAGVRRDDKYAPAGSSEGEILLTPLVSIPKRELLLWQNKAIREGVGRALTESAANDVADLGDFTQFADDGIE